jgi:hypothetical protein
MLQFYKKATSFKVSMLMLFVITTCCIAALNNVVVQ